MRRASKDSDPVNIEFQGAVAIVPPVLVERLVKRFREVANGRVSVPLDEMFPGFERRLMGDRKKL